MGIFYLLSAKLAGIIKVVAVKQCGSAAQGARNSVKINLIRALGCLIVSIAVFLFSRGTLDRTGLIISLLSGFFNAAFLFLWILSAERDSLCLVELFCMLGSVVIPLFLAPYLYKGERVLWHQWVCAGLLFISAFLFFPSAKDKSPFQASKATQTDWKSLLLLLGCAVSSAGTVVTQKLYVTYSKGSISSFNLVTFFIVAACFSLIFLTLLIKDKACKVTVKKEMQSKFSLQIWLLIALATAMLYVNQFLSTQASQYFVSAIFYPLSYAIGWPLTFLTDLLIFKEKTSYRKLIGLSITICASILISL
jgi:drug/metabolite transporter (DMT)-like permease